MFSLGKSVETHQMLSLKVIFKKLNIYEIRGVIEEMTIKQVLPEKSKATTPTININNNTRVKANEICTSSMCLEYTKVSRRKITSKLCVQIRSRRIGIALRLLKPR